MWGTYYKNIKGLVIIFKKAGSELFQTDIDIDEICKVYTDLKQYRIDLIFI